MVLPPYFWAVLLVVVALGVGIWWARTQQLDAQRRSMRAFYALNEQIFAAPTAAEIAERLAESLPSILQASTVRLYLWDRRTASLKSVPTAADPAPVAFPLEGSAEGLAAGAVKCFQMRAPMNIPDVRRHPLVNGGWKSGMLRSAIFAPLLAQQDVLGVIEVGRARRPGFFTPEERATLHHLANQVAASLKLEEQQAVREQLFRSEKLAATGQLISGVASDLRAPLERIQELASSLSGADGSSQIERGLKQLTAEARRAAEIVSRLVSFARPAETAARLVDVNALGSGLLQFRAPEWKTLGLRVQNHLSPEPALVLGVQGQIEEVFLNLLVAAEQAAARSPAKTLEISSSLLAGRVVVEIHYPDDGADAAAVESNIEVCRAIVQNHGGQLRARSESGGRSFEVDLPLAPGVDPRPVRSAPVTARQVLTLMLVDADLGAQRQLLGLLAAHGHRVVPARPEEAGDLAHRLRFDGVVWALRPGGAKWSDFQERLRELIPTFVLVSDGYDADLAASLQESGGYLLGRPLEEPELERVLEAIEARTASRS
ncbi:MAG: GAF domain-containing protein [Acidobacteriota bacterium]|nr:GAF domain-containing protein [Acidobacteriota bacterium]